MSNDLFAASDDVPEADTHIMFTYSRYWKDQGVDPPEGHKNDYVMGRGKLGCICSHKICNSIIEKWWFKTWPRGLVNTFVHEIGHNLGMNHVKKLTTTPGMKDGLCYQGDGPNLKVIMAGRSDWEYTNQIWSPCSRCELLGTFQCLNGFPFK